MFPKRSAKMTDGSKEHKHQLAFEPQNSHVFEKSTIWVRNITEEQQRLNEQN